MVAIVYDSAAAELAAHRLYLSVLEQGEDAVLYDAKCYLAEKHRLKSVDSKIIVGHDSIAQKELKCVTSLEHNKFGMMIGFNDNACILSANKDLSFEEQSKFLAYADDRLRFHNSRRVRLASKYTNPETREADMNTEMKEFMSGMKDWYCDGDRSVSGIATKAVLTAVFSPLLALVGVASLAAKACQKGSRAIDRREVMENQYHLLAIEFERYWLHEFLESTTDDFQLEEPSWLREEIRLL